MLALKLLCCGAVVVAGAALGLDRAGALHRRCLALQDALLLLELVQVRLQNGQGLWLAQLGAVAAEAPFAVLRFSPDSLPLHPRQLTAWLADACPPQLLGADAFGWLASALQCALTRQETAARLDYYCHLLTQALQTARERREKDQKLCLQLGPLAGLLLAVILW